MVGLLRSIRLSAIPLSGLSLENATENLKSERQPKRNDSQLQLAAQ